VLLPPEVAAAGEEGHRGNEGEGRERQLLGRRAGVGKALSRFSELAL
jgi:hypothetical protein